MRNSLEDLLSREQKNLLTLSSNRTLLKDRVKAVSQPFSPASREPEDFSMLDAAPMTPLSEAVVEKGKLKF